MKSRDYYYICELLERGYEFKYQQLTLCNLGELIYTRNNMAKRYQVDIDTYHIKHSEIFTTIHSAVDKFLQLKSRMQ